MKVLCPTCHRPMSEHAPADALKDARLDPQCRIIVTELVAAYPKSVPTVRLFDALYFDDPNGGPDNPRSVVAVKISNLRRQLKPYGWTVPKINIGEGLHGRYRLEPIEEAES